MIPYIAWCLMTCLSIWLLRRVRFWRRNSRRWYGYYCALHDALAEGETFLTTPQWGHEETGEPARKPPDGE